MPKLLKKPRIYKQDGAWVMETEWIDAPYPYRTRHSSFASACSWARWALKVSVSSD